MKITTLTKIIDRPRLAVVFVGRDEEYSWHFITRWLDRDTLKTTRVFSSFTPKTLEMVYEMTQRINSNPPRNGEMITAVAFESKR